MKLARRTIIMAVAGIIFFGIIAQATIVSAQPTVESVIVSKFTGLKKGNTYTLQNGQIWKQTEMWTHPVMRVRPKVTIHKEGGASKMYVEDINRPVAVERVK